MTGIHKTQNGLSLVHTSVRPVFCIWDKERRVRGLLKKAWRKLSSEGLHFKKPRIVGALVYREPITWNKIVGIVICLVGLVFINIK